MNACKSSSVDCQVMPFARSCHLPRCNSLDDKIKLNGMHSSIVHIL